MRTVSSAWGLRLAIVVLALACGGSSAGCGYALAGRGSFLPDYIKTIGIPTFTNRTTVFNVETMLTESVRREFIGRGKFTILPSAGDVDATITGDIVSISLAPASFRENQLASRYVITVVVRIELRDLHENRMLWESQGLSFRQEYDATSGTDALDPNAFFGQQDNALERVSSDFARTIASAILEAF